MGEGLGCACESTNEKVHGLGKDRTAYFGPLTESPLGRQSRALDAMKNPCEPNVAPRARWDGADASARAGPFQFNMGGPKFLERRESIYRGPCNRAICDEL